MTETQEREYTAERLAAMTVQEINDELLMLAKPVNLGNAKVVAVRMMQLSEAWENLTGSAFRFEPDPVEPKRPTVPAQRRTPTPGPNGVTTRRTAPKAAARAKVNPVRRSSGGTVQKITVGRRTVTRLAGVTNVPKNTPNDPAAPWGRKLDGTPAARRGRPKGRTAVNNTAARAAVKTTAAKPPAPATQPKTTAAKPKAPNRTTRAAARAANLTAVNPAKQGGKPTAREIAQSRRDSAPPATFRQPSPSTTVRASTRRKSA